jgi:hypothetical protein
MTLDDILRAWAAETTLPATTTDTIFEEIVTPPRPRRAPATPGLDPRWWTRHSARLATTIAASTRPRRTAFAFSS